MITRYGHPLKLFHGTFSEFETFRPLSHFGTKEAALRKVRGHDKYIRSECYTLLPEDRFTSARKFVLGKPKVIPVFLQLNNPITLPDTRIHNITMYKYIIFHILMKEQLGKKSVAQQCMRSARNTTHLKPQQVFDEMCLKTHFAPTMRFIFNHPFECSYDDVKKELSLEGLYPIAKEADITLSVEDLNRSHLVVQRLIRFFEQRGYDGIRYVNRYESKGKESYIIFRPEQVIRLDRSHDHIPQATPQNTIALDVIQRAILPQLIGEPLTLQEREEYFRYDKFWESLEQRKQPPDSVIRKSFWIQYALKKVLPQIEEYFGKDKMPLLEQTVLLGIDYAIKEKINPFAVVWTCALHQCHDTRKLVSFAQKNRYDNIIKKIPQYLVAIQKYIAGERVPYNGISRCAWDAIHTVKTWQTGNTDGYVFNIDLAKQLISSSESRHKYLQHQIALLNRHPNWPSVLRPIALAKNINKKQWTR